MPTKKHVAWLRTQLPEWQRAALISDDQAKAIDSYYPQNTQTNVGRLVFSSIGAVLFGLGIILFFAYNWQAMPRLLKLSVIFTAFLVSQASALWYDKRHRIAGEGLALLGTMIFGAAIWLISQIYHIDAHYPNAYLLWGLAALAMAWARQSAVQGLCALLLLTCWAGLEILDFNRPTYIASLIVLIGIGSLAWRLRAAWLVFATLCSSLFLWIFGLEPLADDHLIFITLATAIAFVSLGLATQRTTSPTIVEMRLAILVPGFTLYLGLLFITSFAGVADEIRDLKFFTTSIHKVIFLSTLGISLLSPALLVTPGKRWQPADESAQLHAVLLWCSVLAFFILTTIVNIPDGALAGIINLIFIGHCLLFIVHGSHIQRGWEVSVGCILFALLVFARYTDLFDSLLSRSLVFLILGSSLFFVGNFYSRYKRPQSQQRGET